MAGAQSTDDIIVANALREDASAIHELLRKLSVALNRPHDVKSTPDDIARYGFGPNSDFRRRFSRGAAASRLDSCSISMSSRPGADVPACTSRTFMSTKRCAAAGWAEGCSRPSPRARGARGALHAPVAGCRQR